MSETNLPSILNPRFILDSGFVYSSTLPINQSGEENQVQQVGIDLRLAKAYRIVGAPEFYVTKKSSKPSLVEMQPFNGCFLFKAGQQYSIDFIEDVKIPSNAAALIVNRSTINRFSGTVSSGFFDSGYESSGGCGAVYRPTVDTTIEVGFRMAQIAFFTAESASLYAGQYQNSKEKN